MPTCPSCSAENSDRARFCELCGTPLSAPEPTQHRKIVTIVFSDVVGFTRLGEQLDPEMLRSVMTRFYEAMRSVVERHGGTVANFIGDAVMAVFGVPQVHEDDALRAVRAATEMQQALALLNEALEAERGVTLAIRTGVNTGEVMAGDSADNDVIVGDAVNVAARLEQAAEPGTILLGATTYGLVRDAVTAAPVEPLHLKGKAEPLPAHRLEAVRALAPGRERHLDAPMVGRERQLRALRDAFEAVATSRTCYLFTILGSPGVGKTRLVEEFTRGVPGGMHRGRCLSYGEGIALWPINEIVRSIAGVDEFAPADETDAAIGAALVEADDADEVRSRLAGLLALAPVSVDRDDGFWAVRRLLEHTAGGGPLVLVVDDIHWADPLLLDLVEHLADWSHQTPLLIICTARPELLDVRPTWGGGKTNAASTLLEPLRLEEAASLVTNLVGTGLPAGVRDQITAGAGGNPLFVEEMIGMLIDDGVLRRDEHGWSTESDVEMVAVPASIQTLIAARLDRLDRAERTIVERGAVEGNLFHVGSVTALAPGLDDIPGHLMTLVRRDLIRPDRAEFAGDDAFRFRHLLIRDAAYESMPKHTRAELHEQFAGWLVATAAATAGGLDGIVAHHFDQAQQYLLDLGAHSERARQLAASAGSHYGSAARQALTRDDPVSAITLFRRALDLLPTEDPRRVAVHLELGRAHILLSDYEAADTELATARRAAAAAGDTVAELNARVGHLEVADRVSTELGGDEFIGRAADLERQLLDLGDGAGAARAILAAVNWRRRGEAVGHAKRAADLARRAGHPELAATAEFWSVLLSFWGPTPASESLASIDAFLDSSIASRRTEADAVALRGGTLGMLGRFDEGRAALQRARDIAESIGSKALGTAFPFQAGFLELFAGDLDAAARNLRAGYEFNKAVGEKNRFSSLAALLAFCVQEDDVAAAEALLAEAEEAATSDDEDTHAIVAATRSVLARRGGDPDEAVIQAQRAIALAESRDAWAKGIWFEELAEARAAAGDVPAAREAYEAALQIFRRKEVPTLVERAERRLAEL